MIQKKSKGRGFITAGLLVVGLLWLPATSAAQDMTGQAKAVQATVLGATKVLSDTGTLAGSTDAREASQLTGSIPSLLTGEALHATTIGWPDQVVSEASLGSLGMTVAGIGISADFVMSRAQSVLGGSNTGQTNIDGLKIGWMSVSPTGSPNQTVSFGALTVVLNEQIPSADGITVNAMHVRTLDGLTDVVVGSAKAGIGSGGSSSGGGDILPPLF
jgi:hypothetical protein